MAKNMPAVVRIINSMTGATGKTPDEILFSFNPWLLMEITLKRINKVRGTIGYTNKLVYFERSPRYIDILIGYHETRLPRSNKDLTLNNYY
jgi:hypothetical protein